LNPQFKLTRNWTYLFTIAVAFLLPIAIPGFGVDWPFLFTIGLVLIAWLTIKWATFKALPFRSNTWEIILGVAIVAIDYAWNVHSGSFLGLIDMLAVFVAISIAFYGIKAMKFFWVPAMYILILLIGYQIEYNVPSTQGLQVWMANLMASFMNVLGVKTTVAGSLVVMQSGSTSLLLSVEGPCTGLQGVLAFGMLSSVAVLDIKTSRYRLGFFLAMGLIGSFLINIVRLFVVFLTFEYAGVDAGTTMHVYLGYTLFIAWVLLFWMIAFKYLPQVPSRTTLGAVRPPKNPLS
jgi:exosortase